MNSSEQFHEHLQAGRLTAAISLVVGQIVELDITTNATPGSLHTKVNLLTGQIISTVDPAFVSDKAYQRLLEFHTNQIAAASQIVREQLRSLQDLLHTIETDSLLVTSADPVSAPAMEPVIVAAPNVVPALAVPTIESPLEPIRAQVAHPETVAPAPTVISGSHDIVVKVNDPANISTSTGLVTPAIDVPPTNPSTPPANIQLPASKPMDAAVVKTGIASGLAAAVAQAGAPNPLDATAIPNKFDQALKSAGIRQDTEEAYPFAPNSTVAKKPFDPAPKPLPDRELIDLLSESGDDWDEWLLEEDNILSELSEAGDLMTKDKLAKQSKVGGFAGRPPAEWDEFLPEYDAAAHKNQANVERFRQNLVNDPQLMSELLAELDNIEQLDSEGRSKH
jgi:hypothetical protein